MKQAQHSVSDGSRAAGETAGLDPKDDSAMTEGQTPKHLLELRGIFKGKERPADFWSSAETPHPLPADHAEVVREIDAERDEDGTVTVFWKRGDDTVSLVCAPNGALTRIVSPYREAEPPLGLHVLSLSSQAEEIERRAPTSSEHGWVYHNPDSGTEYSRNHPIESGECGDAEDLRPATAMEETLNEALQREWQRAEALQSDIERITKELQEANEAYLRIAKLHSTLKAEAAEQFDQWQAAESSLASIKAQRDGECDRANRLAEFIRNKGLTAEYHEQEAARALSQITKEGTDE